MKNGTFLFLGIFAALAISWAGLALGTNAQIAGVRPYYDQLEDKTFPEPMAGIAKRGRVVYQNLGCASCHTQAVHRAGSGSDIERKWGTRQSVARDYIYQERVQLGQSRLGPDLTNVGNRVKTANEIYQLLYHGTAIKPAYRFLFVEHPHDVEPSSKVVARIGDREVVPSAQAEELAAYLLSLKTAYDYPEAKPFVSKAKEGAHP